jgi:MFS family permease
VTSPDSPAAALPTAPRGQWEGAPKRVVVGLALNQLGLFFGLLTPVVVGLTLKLQAIFADVPDAQRSGQLVGALAIITTAGAAAAFIANPIFGRLSDRTTSRWGRRRPWLLVGGLTLTLALIVIAFADSVPVLVVAWTVAQFGGNAAVAAQNASLADQVPTPQRGRISGLVGVFQNVGILGGSYVGTAVGGNVVLIFVIPAIVVAVITVFYCLVLPDKVLSVRPKEDRSWKEVLGTFYFNPVKHPDLAWVWISRALMVLALFMFTTYRLLYMQKDLGLSKTEALSVLPIAVLLYTAALAVSAQISGFLSDKFRRRKIFLVVSAVVFAVGMYLFVHAGSTTGFYTAEIVLGLGWGIYTAIDLATAIDVLPSEKDVAKDLGVFNIASSLPQALAPAIGAVFIQLAGGSYTLMLTVAAIFAVVGAAAILPVRKVR